MLITAVAVAPEPPPPVKDTVGAVVYPDPLFPICTLVTLPPATVAVAVAPEPLVPVLLKTTVGAELYPEPPPAALLLLLTITFVTPLPPTLAGSCPYRFAHDVNLFPQTSQKSH